MELGSCASKLKGGASVLSDLNLEADPGTVVHVADGTELASGVLRADILEESPDGNLGVGLDGIHVELHRLLAVPVHQPLEDFGALVVGSGKGLEVSDVITQTLRAVASRPGYWLGKDLGDALMVELAATDHGECVDCNTLLPQLGGVGRHERPLRAADVSVVATRGKEEEDLLASLVEHRSDDGQVGQMCSSAHYKLLATALRF